MKKAMISIPMTGRDPADIKADMAKYKKILEKHDYEVIDSYVTEEPGEDIKNNDLWYIARSILHLSEVDVLYMGKDWMNSKGCRIEHMIARDYGVHVAFDRSE